jgi:Flp pilus assembly protein TadD
MVFSSKSRSPYTQMFLTHIDEAGNDSPPILIENATAANRAVNIPEFVNIPPDGIVKIDTPAADYARHMDRAVDLMKNGKYEDAVPEWNQALELAPREWRAHNSLGVALMETGKVGEAIGHYREALALNPEYAEAYNNLGEASAKQGAVDEAIAQFEKAVASDPNYAVAEANLGRLLARTGRADEAIVHVRRVVEITPDAADAHRDLGHALAEQGNFEEASVELEEAIRLSDGKDPLALHLLGRVYADMGRRSEALQTDRRALSVAAEQHNSMLVQAVNVHLAELMRQQ